MRTASRLHCSAQFRDRRHQNHRIQRRRLEAEAQVEAPGSIGEGVHDQSAYPDGFRGMDDAQGGVLEEGAAESLPMMSCRNCEAAEHNYRNGIRHVAAKSPGSG